MTVFSRDRLRKIFGSLVRCPPSFVRRFPPNLHPNPPFRTILPSFTPSTSTHCLTLLSLSALLASLYILHSNPFQPTPDPPSTTLSPMAAIDFDDLVATMKGSGIGQEAMDLRALHAHLSQTLFLPPSHSQAGQPTPQSSYYTNPPPPPSSLNSTASTSYNMNNSTSYHPSSFKSDYEGGKSSFPCHFDGGGATSRGPIPERGFPPPSSSGSPFGHHQPFGSSQASSGNSYSNFFPPQAPSSGSNAFESSAPPPTSPFGRQTRSQTRATASATPTPPDHYHQENQQQQPFPGMNFHSGHGAGGRGAPPPTPRSLSLVRGGGRGSDDVEMGA
ncbi:hypothetical protein BDY24DRAFT_111641 [Mrakia frigida]|uniref:uncharacterized protein n=1 Tax=Mrakia frigida TaxID=29902 RepID=UPI003FCC13D5